jgi:hypothetical protein
MANSTQHLTALTVTVAIWGCALPKYTEHESSTSGVDSAGRAGGYGNGGRSSAGAYGQAGNGSSAQGGVSPTTVVTGSAGASHDAAGNAATIGGTTTIVGSGAGAGGQSVPGSGGNAAGAASGGAALGGSSTIVGGASGSAAGGTASRGGATTGGTKAVGGTASGGSTAAVCNASDMVCVGANLMKCNAQRTALDELVASCASDALCLAGVASGACQSPACAVGSYTCQNTNRIPCNSARTGYDATNPEPCTGTTPFCTSGTCVACLNGDKDCAAGVPRQCSGNAWVTGTACSAVQACAVGDCIDARVARWKMPNEPGSAYNPASYQVVASGAIVRDLVTGLEWQAGVSPQPVAASGASQYCQQLSLGGYHDFRMPTAIELFSLVDYSIVTGLLINAAFQNTPTLSIARESMLAVNFETGDIQREVTTGLDYVLRCVRSTVGALSSPRYSAIAGAVTDNFTGLNWNQANDKTMVYGSTFRSTGCPAPKRVPTVKELMTLVDRSVGTAPFIDTSVFTTARSDNYWSITGTDPGYVVDFSTGYTAILSMSTDAAGRCLL